MRGLYAIIDVPAPSTRQLDPVRIADAVLSAGPGALQIRDKGLRAEQACYERVAARARARQTTLTSQPLEPEDRS